MGVSGNDPFMMTVKRQVNAEGLAQSDLVNGLISMLMLGLLHNE